LGGLNRLRALSRCRAVFHFRVASKTVSHFSSYAFKMRVVAKFLGSHISYAYLHLVISMAAAYFRDVQFHSSSQKLNSKRGTPPPSRAFQISPLRTPPPSEAGFLVFSPEFGFYNFTTAGDLFSRALLQHFSIWHSTYYAVAACLIVIEFSSKVETVAR